jgi:hypothetical protein
LDKSENIHLGESEPINGHDSMVADAGPSVKRPVQLGPVELGSWLPQEDAAIWKQQSSLCEWDQQQSIM